MELYHGSNVEVRTPRLLRDQRALDFGNGFYTTSDLRQASSWARRTARLRGKGRPCVTVYEVDESSFDDLRVLRFNEPDEAWLSFVAKNRRSESIPGDWDVVVGPVANDQTMPTLLLFIDGFLTADRTIELLMPQKLKDQFVFKTVEALRRLRCIEVISV
ncbi:DUF3990 domain-containing protein [Adlercreutzia sp. ZJ242]|uniref:DUF3990 domain-containing protein n=1 Tax=Adlercreutzia sp. ZJ242 TaxID=2709409 RepID=UPI0013EBD214|nr:DUF3990 domain-containing protein [Adlercreutzia sp. ZJ242]